VADMKEFKGLIYRATNIINGKVYIGQTGKTLEQRFKTHKRNAMLNNSQLYFHRAIRKYGFYSFTWDIIEECKSKQVLFEREIYWIALYNSTNINRGYNMSEGGYNPRLKGKLNPNFGGLQKGVAEKISKTLKGTPNKSKGKKRTPEQIEINRIKHTGKKFSDEVNKKKGRPKTGDKNPMFGKTKELSPFYKKPREEQTKEKISKTCLLKGSHKGANNGRAKTYKIVFENDEVIIIKSLKTWCRERDISQSKLRYAINNNKTVYGIKHIIEIKKGDL
jgi:group I intron endonuclease